MLPTDCRSRETGLGEDEDAATVRRWWELGSGFERGPRTLVATWCPFVGKQQAYRPVPPVMMHEFGF